MTTYTLFKRDRRWHRWGVVKTPGNGVIYTFTTRGRAEAWVKAARRREAKMKWHQVEEL